MIHNYYKVDENGEILEKYRLDESDSLIKFKGLIKEWSGRVLSPKYDFRKGKWVSSLPLDYAIEHEKRKKDALLSRECQNAIVSGFPLEVFGSTYYFSYDKEAQTNILDTMRLFENNMIDEIAWNGRLRSVDGKRVRMKLNKEQFNQLYMASVKHKLSCISKYRDDLTELLNNAKTIDEIESITWESIKESSFKATLKDDQTVEKIIDENEMKQARGDTELFNMIIMGMV